MTGYTEITIGDKKIPLLFGMKAVESYFNKVNLLAGQAVTSELMNELIWAGIDNAAYRERKIVDVSFAEVYDFTESCFMTPEGRDLMTRIYKCFEDSAAVKALTEQGKEKKKKK